MSIIMPAGTSKVEWSPKDETLVKTASTGKEIKEEVNPLYEAAKLVMAQAECPSEVKKEDMAPAIPAQKKEGEIVEEVKVEDGKDVIVEPVAEEKAEATKMEQAVEKIEEAVVELKEVAEEEKGEVDEVEIEIEDIPGKQVSDSEVIVTSEPDMTACGSKKTEKTVEAKKEEKKEEKCEKCNKCPCECKKEEKEAAKEVVMDKAAATDAEFTKFAKISAGNKKKIVDYWVKWLGYPQDYVSLMVKDYEK